MTDLDDELPAICRGDLNAFSRWLAAAEPRLRGGMRRFAAEVDTEAVIQETLLRAWQLAPRVVPDGRPNALLRLAIRIAHNLCIDELRRGRVAAVDDDELERALEREGTPRAASPDPLLRRVIARCREALRGQPALALAARIDSAGGEPDAALAARLAMRLNTFVQNLARARRLLAACLERQGVRLDEELET